MSKLKCPICKKPVAKKEAGIWPFCSKRCKMLDFGKWINEDYAVAVAEPGPESAKPLPDPEAES